MGRKRTLQVKGGVAGSVTVVEDGVRDRFGAPTERRESRVDRVHPGSNVRVPSVRFLPHLFATLSVDKLSLAFERGTSVARVYEIPVAIEEQDLASFRHNGQVEIVHAQSEQAQRRVVVIEAANDLSAATHKTLDGLVDGSKFKRLVSSSDVQSL